MTKYVVTDMRRTEKEVEADGYMIQDGFIHFTSDEDGLVYSVRESAVKSVEARRGTK